METTQLQILVTEYLDQMEQADKYGKRAASEGGKAGKDLAFSEHLKRVEAARQTRKIINMLGYTDRQIVAEIQYLKTLNKIILSKGE